jgi:hypothetical protein
MEEVAIIVSNLNRFNVVFYISMSYNPFVNVLHRNECFKNKQ